MSFPTPPPGIEPTSIFSGLRPLPILYGALVDHVATLLAGTVLFVAFAADRSIDLSKEISDEAVAEVLASPEFLLCSFIVGALCTVLGGYLGARRAGCQHARHGAFVGLASLLIGLLLFVLPLTAEPPPLWYDLLGAAVVVPCGAAGGWLAEKASSERAG
jgi:putative membrane protein (TIGR04086 family)